MTDATTQAASNKAKKNYNSYPFMPRMALLYVGAAVALVAYIFFPPENLRDDSRNKAAMASCAKLYSDPHFNDLTFGLTEEKQMCRRRISHFRDMIHTEFTITGSALRLVDSTHSLVGLSVARSRTGREYAGAPDLSTLAIFADEKIVATMQFGDPARADAAFNRISDAIATAQMLQVLAAGPQP